MSGTAPRRNAEQFVVRMPPGMRDQLKRRAEENRRSLNSEILVLLEAAVAAEGATAAGQASQA